MIKYRISPYAYIVISTHDNIYLVETSPKKALITNPNVTMTIQLREKNNWVFQGVYSDFASALEQIETWSES